MLNTWTWDKRKCRCWCCEEKLKLWRGRLKSFTNKMTNYWSAHYSNPQVFFFTITIRYLINPAEIIQPGLWQYRWLYPQMTVTLRQYLFTECSPAIKQVMIVKLLKHNNYSLVKKKRFSYKICIRYFLTSSADKISIQHPAYCIVSARVWKKKEKKTWKAVGSFTLNFYFFSLVLGWRSPAFVVAKFSWKDFVICTENPFLSQNRFIPASKIMTLIIAANICDHEDFRTKRCCFSAPLLHRFLM